MNAVELTKIVNNQQNRIIELEKEVKYMNQEFEKQRIIVEDLKIDIQMLNRK